MALIDFTLSNARRFYSSMGNPSGLKGLKGFEPPPRAVTSANRIQSIQLAKVIVECPDSALEGRSQRRVGIRSGCQVVGETAVRVARQRLLSRH